MEKNYVAVDLETTGLSAKKDHIIEIGAIQVKNGQIVGKWNKLIDPRVEIPERIEGITGITQKMLKGQSYIEEVIGEFYEFCEDLPLLGHNILFDYRFLKKEMENAGLGFEREGIDTLKIARKCMPKGESKTLLNACTYFGIEVRESHRALSDAISAHLLYQEMGRGKQEEYLLAESLQCKVKKDVPAMQRQKEYLQKLLNYHRIEDKALMALSRSEISRLTDKIIRQYGRMER